MTDRNQIGPCSPFFVVSNIEKALRHYVDVLGFACAYKGPDGDPFFAIVNRGSAQIMLKFIAEDCRPTPNRRHHEDARWDAFVFVPDPEALAEEFAGKAVPFHRPLARDEDGLLGFEVADPDGYVCYFGKPG